MLKRLWRFITTYPWVVIEYELSSEEKTDGKIVKHGKRTVIFNGKKTVKEW